MSEKIAAKATVPQVPYYNRELSWMDFNMRVLEECFEKENPVMERVRFLSITASNLDEFFMVRVAGVMEQVRSKYRKPDPSGMMPDEIYQALAKKIHEFSEKTVFLPAPFYSARTETKRNYFSVTRGNGRGTTRLPFRVL